MGIIIRPWLKTDLEDLRRITWQSWIATYSSFIPEIDLKAYFDIYYDRGAFSAVFTDPSAHGYVAEIDDCMAGYARILFNREENRLYLTALYLLPDFQGRGIGKRLIRAVEEHAAERHIEEIRVGVMVQNSRALGFYEKGGFQFIREEPFTMGKTTVSHFIGYKKMGRRAKISTSQRNIFAVFDGARNQRGLQDLCLDLLSGQKHGWDDLRKGYELLKTVKEREVPCGGFTVRLQFNPGRITSSTAVVSDEAVRNRPCFLCVENLPEKQAGVLYRDEFLILCNPMPIFPFHFTISHIDHRAQMIDPNIRVFLRLMADLGPDWVILYNGAKCGASAPDHLHLQACPSGRMPVGLEIEEEKRWVSMKKADGVTLCRALNLGREVLILEGSDPARVENVFRKFTASLRKTVGTAEEPLLNIAGFCRGGKWRLLIFPRGKHRPDAFFREGDDRVVISPGVIDMGGALIIPVERDFERLDAAAVETIYREVSLDEETVEKAIDAMTG
ncbi:MAG: GNAT family N-acetyltransferase [Deltaproteobacteria bacterium]|nr:GNAT family N-acetyltransferase [Deltaproteobacteria bacterium]